MKPLLTALLVQLVLLQFLHAQAPMPDLSFGEKGIFRFTPNEPFFSTDADLLGKDATGALYFRVTSRDVFDVRYNARVYKMFADGRPDDNYNNSAPFIGTSGIYAIGADGSLYSLYHYTEYYWVYNMLHLIRYKPDGSRDKEFGTGGVVSMLLYLYQWAAGLHVDNKGRIMVLGSTQNGQFGLQYFMLRLFPDGSLDREFGTDGQVVMAKGTFTEGVGTRGETEGARTIHFTEDNKIVAGGIYQITTNTIQDGFQVNFGAFISKFLENGQRDLSFNGTGKVLPEAGYFGNGLRSFLMKDGSVLLAWIFASDMFTSRLLLERYLPTGELDRNFGTAGQLDIPTSSFLVTSRQQIVVLERDNNREEAVLRFYRQNGQPDTTVGPDGYYRVALPAPFVDNPLYDIYWVNERLLLKGQMEETTRNGFVFAFTLKDPEPLQCPAPKVVATDKGSCSAVAGGLAPANTNASIRYRLEGATTGTGLGVPTDKRFNKGLTTVTYWPESNPEQTCSFTVEVQDREAPVIAGLKPSQSELRAPNHKMQDITLNYDARDNCGLKQVTVAVSSNEPVRGAGSGNTSPDWEVVSPTLVRLRAERSGKGNGRVYTITVMAEDESGNRSSATTQVRVPKGNGKNAIAAAGKDYEMENGALRILPLANPTSGAFTVKVESGDAASPVTLRLVDMQGRLVSRMQVLPNTQQTIGGGLSKGMYLLEAIQGRQRVTKKLVHL